MDMFVLGSLDAISTHGAPVPQSTCPSHEVVVGIPSAFKATTVSKIPASTGFPKSVPNSHHSISPNDPDALFGIPLLETLFRPFAFFLTLLEILFLSTFLCNVGTMLGMHNIAT